VSLQKEQVISSLKAIESFLYQEHSVEVDYSPDHKDVYYQDISRIEINSRQNYNSRLNSLLHEAGHVIIRSEVDWESKRFPYMKDQGSFIRGNISHRVDVLREEVMAWEEAKKLVNYLSLEVDEELFARHRTAALKSYIDWV
tara:strand:- start:232 stop:657 length:426 start_codon:yes stop_codon:yes gene_type:complete